MTAETERVAIDTGDLELGMYVAELDRPWLETPFLFQGFMIDSEDDLQQLRESCAYVLVDVERSSVEVEKVCIPLEKTPAPANAEVRFIRPDQPVYTDTRSCEEEGQQAEQLQLKVGQAFVDFMQNVKATGTANIEALETAIAPVVESVTRNPDALLWLTKMQDKGGYIYRHAVCSSVLAVTIGRHLGLNKHLLSNLAMGGMLLDVGKTLLPDDLLNKPGPLTPQEYELAKTHVEKGVELLEKTDGATDEILVMVRCHHERHDGSGYPYGLQGSAIPPLGKIAGLVDTFDAMTSMRDYGERTSMHKTLNYFNRERDKTFDGSLVEQFIQALGIYPTGSLVELSDGTVGAVIEQNRLRRLQPRVLLLLGPDKTRLPKPQAVDLLNESELHGKEALRIIDCLDPETFKIDPNDLFLEESIHD